jgi:hypothetical protein
MKDLPPDPLPLDELAVPSNMASFSLFQIVGGSAWFLIFRELGVCISTTISTTISTISTTNTTNSTF